MVDIEQIRNTIPHRYPFLLVDKILDMNDDLTTCCGIKNVTANEAVVYGRDPKNLYFPHPLIVEHMAQVGCYVLMKKPGTVGKLAYFAAIDGVEFKKNAVPGDTIETNVSLVGGRRGIWKMQATSRVDGEIICEGTLTCSLVDK